MSEKWNKTVAFPRDNYVLRCTEQTFGPSSKGKPMITLKFEIASPENISVSGVEYQVVGLPLTHYAVTQSQDEQGKVDEAKTESCKQRVADLFSKFGLPSDNIDWANPKLDFVGKSVWVGLRDRVNEVRKTPTPEQVKFGKPGDIIMNPVTGQPRVEHYPDIEQFFGLANNVGGAF